MSLLLALSALTLGTPGPAVQTPQPLPASTAPDNVLICKYRKNLNSRIRSKVCRTRAQWDSISENSRQVIKEIVDRPQIFIM